MKRLRLSMACGSARARRGGVQFLRRLAIISLAYSVARVRAETGEPRGIGVAAVVTLACIRPAT